MARREEPHPAIPDLLQDPGGPVHKRLTRLRQTLSRNPILQYSVPVISVSVVVAVRLIFAPLLGTNVAFVMFLVPTIVTASLAGRAPALLAAVLGVASADYLYMPSFLSDFWHVAIWTLVYLLVSVVVVAVFDSEQRQKVRAEAALLELERNAELVRTQALLLDSSHDSIIIADPQRRITAWNAGAQKMYGWSSAEACGNVTHSRLQIEGALAAEIDEVLLRDTRWDGELVHATKDGRRLVVESRQVLLRDETNRPAAILEINRDITLRKRAEQGLRESEERLRLAQQVARVGTFEWNIQTGVNRWTPELEAMYGLPPGGFAGTQEAWEELVHPDDRPEALRRVREAMEKGGFEGEWRVTWPDGTVRWLAGRAWVFKDESGRPLRLVGAHIDITERKSAEEALRESEMRERARATELQAVLDAVPAVIFIARDPQCRRIIGSRATYDLLRLPPGGNLSKTPLEGEKPLNFRVMKDGKEIPAHELPMQKAGATGQPIRNYEFDFVFDDGSCRTMLGDAIPTLDESGRVQGVVAAFLDITEHKRSEEGFRHAQKLESIGVLAGGIAHDFNNLLASIMGYASLLESDVKDAGREKVEAILQASQRAADLTRQLLAYAGKGRFIVREVDLSKTVRELAELLYASIPKKVHLEQALAPGMPPVEADPGHIQQIVMNLVLNAAEAIPANREGTVTVRTSVEEITPEGTVTDAISREPLTPGRYVCLEVRDTGTGMDQPTMARIFDPFFTTKFAGRGLGLAAIGGIVKAHRGAVQLTSSPGNGSTFRVLLPAAVKRIAGEAAAVSDDLRGSGTVLVVDDEEMMRNFARRALEQLGYKVLTAKDGRDAIGVFEENSGRIDVILLDLTMPVLSGKEAWEVLKEKCPTVRGILMSGYSESEAVALFDGEGISSFLQKPFPVSRLAEQVKAALNGRRVRRN